MLIDTHAHLQFPEFNDDLEAVLARARAAGVGKLLCVGVDELDSASAIELAAAHDNIWPTVGLHPHVADRGPAALSRIEQLARRGGAVAIGECGLDYFKSETSAHHQELALRFQIELALNLDLPLIFHVRDAFDDFWRVLDSYHGVRGVVHSFTATTRELDGSLDRGLYIALNGIMTFTKRAEQLEAAKKVPSQRLILESDCPFLAPVPVRGSRNEPAGIAHTANFLAELRGEDLTRLEKVTTQNAEALFSI